KYRFGCCGILGDWLRHPGRLIFIYACQRRRVFGVAALVRNWRWFIVCRFLAVPHRPDRPYPRQPGKMNSPLHSHAEHPALPELPIGEWLSPKELAGRFGLKEYSAYRWLKMELSRRSS